MLPQGVPTDVDEPDEADKIAFGTMLLKEDGAGRPALPFGPTLRVKARKGALTWQWGGYRG